MSLPSRPRFAAASLPAVFDALFQRWPQGEGVRPCSVQQVQHVLYYAQSWHLALHEQPLFPGRFHAENWGPFCPRAHALFTGAEQPAPEPVLSLALLHHLDEVIQAYLTFTDAQLQGMSTSEEPWLQTERGSLIDEKIMGSYYARLLQPHQLDSQAAERN